MITVSIRKRHQVTASEGKTFGGGCDAFRVQPPKVVLRRGHTPRAGAGRHSETPPRSAWRAGVLSAPPLLLLHLLRERPPGVRGEGQHGRQVA
jgi:hypothetical protein